MKAIYLFYIFKFAPKVINNKTNKFWRRHVKLLNSERKKSGDSFYFLQLGCIFLRDPYAIPTNNWYSSSFHPLCWKKRKD